MDNNFIKNPAYDPNNPASNRYVSPTIKNLLNPVDARIEKLAGSTALSTKLNAVPNASFTTNPLLVKPAPAPLTPTPKPVAVTTPATPATPAPTVAAPVQQAPGAVSTPSYDPSVTGTAIDPTRLSSNELKDLAKRAGQAGLSLQDYTDLVNQNAKLGSADINKIRTDLGIDEKAKQVFTAPKESLNDIYKNLYKEAGLSDVKTKIAELDASLNKKREDFTKVEGSIKNNPWLSSASRRGRLANAASLALADINNDLTAKQQYLDLYDQGASQIEKQLNNIVSDRNLQSQLDTNQLNYLLNEAERIQGVQEADKSALGLRNVPDFLSGRRSEQLRIEAADAAAKASGSAEVPVLRIDEAGNVTPGTKPPKAPTAGESQTLIFFQRMADAINNLDAVEENISKQGLIGQLRMKAFDAPLLLSEDQGKYEQAARAFTEARLRKDSGAAIPDTEYAADNLTYFPQPGDTKEILAQKKQSRQVAINALRVASGNAYWDLYGVNPIEETVARLQAGGATDAGGVKPSPADTSYAASLNLNK